MWVGIACGCRRLCSVAVLSRFSRPVYEPCVDQLRAKDRDNKSEDDARDEYEVNPSLTRFLGLREVAVAEPPECLCRRSGCCG
jgi:hypothetical protein